MTAPRISAVPLHESDLVRRACVHGFTLTEAWSPPRRIPPHAHAELSLTILLEGAFEERYRPANTARQRPHDCSPGCVLIRPAGEVHENHLGARGARTLSLELAPGRLELCGKSLAPILSLELRREAAFLDIGLAISRELHHPDTASSLALESLSLELLARLLRIGDSISYRRHLAGAFSSGPPPWLSRARDAIHERFREQSLRVAALAAEHGVHPVYLARAFRRHYRVTPGEYVRRLRVECAARQLVDSADSLASIALECGFADQSHLTRAFRRRFGLSPGRLRRSRGVTRSHPSCARR